MPFIALTEKAFTRLVNEQYAVLQRSIAAHERLERIVLSERGLDAVVARAVDADRRRGAWCSTPRGEPLGSPRVPQADRRRRRRPRCARELRVARAAPASGAASCPTIRRSATRALALPIAAGGAPAPNGSAAAGVAGGGKDGGGLTEFDRLTLHQAVTIVALELLRRRVAEDTERRLAGDVLSELVARRGRRPRARPPARALRDRRPSRCDRARSGTRARAAAVEAALGVAVRDEVDAGLVAAHGALVCALLPAARSARRSCSRSPSA